MTKTLYNSPKARVPEQHPRCGRATDCPCWRDGAVAEAKARAFRPQARELQDYIRALSETDPALNASEIAMRAAEVFGPQQHFVTFTETGYGLEHPIRCRPDLNRCDFNRWLDALDEPEMNPGRYVMLWPEEGAPHYISADAMPPADYSGRSAGDVLDELRPGWRD